MTAREPTLVELIAEERYARERVALQQRRMDFGKGDPRRMAELQRIAENAAQRLAARRSRDRA
jgi:hypothetical protein